MFLLPLGSLWVPKLNSTSLNLTPLNSTQLNSSFDPPRASFWSHLAPPNRPKIGPSRLLTPYFVQKRDVSRNAVSPRLNPLLRPQDGTQDDPRSTQDGSKTIFKICFFRPRFCFRFWSVLGPILVPFWLHLGPLLGFKIGPSAAP